MNPFVKKGLLVPVVCMLFHIPVPANQPDSTYPTDERLFYIERLKNKNIVCYDINPEPDGYPNKKQPINAYWINREKYHGRKEKLTDIEKRLAYGYELSGIEGDTIKVKMNAFKNKLLKIIKSNDKYICVTDLSGRPAQLNRIFVRTKRPDSLSVEYVELYGTAIDTGETCSERITP